jgi:hypothetical protein
MSALEDSSGLRGAASTREKMIDAEYHAGNPEEYSAGIRQRTIRSSDGAARARQRSRKHERCGNHDAEYQLALTGDAIQKMWHAGSGSSTISWSSPGSSSF